MSCAPIFIGNDNLLTVEGVFNEATKTYVNDATVTVTLKDSAGVDIAGQTWPLTLSYVTGSDGNYQGTLEDTLVVTDGSSGVAYVAIAGDALTAAYEVPVTFGDRGVNDFLWTSRSELEAMFGLTNITKWADLENNAVEAEIDARIRWAAEEATEDAKMRLKGSTVNVDDMPCVPKPLRIATTKLAGVYLYESRGIYDASDETGRHRLTSTSKTVNRFFREVKAGVIRLADDRRHDIGVVSTEPLNETTNPFDVIGS